MYSYSGVLDSSENYLGICTNLPGKKSHEMAHTISQKFKSRQSKNGVV